MGQGDRPHCSQGAAQPPCWAGSPALGPFPCQPLRCWSVPAAAKAALIHPTHPRASFPQPLLAAGGSRGSASPTAPSLNNAPTAPAPSIPAVDGLDSRSRF